VFILDFDIATRAKPQHLPQIGGRSSEAADGHAGVFCQAGRENRVCGVDRRTGPPACLLPQDGCRAERTSIGSERKSEKQETSEQRRHTRRSGRARYTGQAGQP